MPETYDSSQLRIVLKPFLLYDMKKETSNGGTGMYQILLVDDEWLELDTLEKYVPWAEMGFSVSGTAKNGVEALRFLESLNPGEIPDVLLTDVKMPVMNGVELSRKVHKHWPHMQIVFLSGYTDFEYVREALAVEACGYILKPLNMDELKKTMDKVKEKYLQNTQKNKSQVAATTENMKHLLGFFGENGNGSWDEVRKACNAYLRLNSENRHFYIALLTIDEYHFLANYLSDQEQILPAIASGIQHFSEENKVLSFHINDHSYLLVGNEPLKEKLETYLVLKNDAARWITACTYLKKHTTEEFATLYEEMARYRKWHVKMYGSGHVIICDTFTPSITDDTSHEELDFSNLMQSLQSGNIQGVKAWLPAYCQKTKRAEGSLINGAIMLTEKIYASVISPNASLFSQMEEKASLYGKLTAAESPALIEDLLLAFLTNVSEILTENTGDRRKQLIEQVKHLIQQEYSTALTVEYLAGSVYMSPNYLRTLFKDYTGKTVLEYITGIRMEESARLLRETNLRIHDISQRIGYENPSHYCAVFRKKMGLTPNQYRSKYMKISPRKIIDSQCAP